MDLLWNCSSGRHPKSAAQHGSIQSAQRRCSPPVGRVTAVAFAAKLRRRGARPSQYVVDWLRLLHREKPDQRTRSVERERHYKSTDRTNECGRPNKIVTRIPTSLRRHRCRYADTDDGTRTSLWIEAKVCWRSLTTRKKTAARGASLPESKKFLRIVIQRVRGYRFCGSKNPYSVSSPGTPLIPGKNGRRTPG